MTNDDIYNLVNFIVRKDKKGSPDIIQNFTRLLREADSDHFKQEYLRYQQNQNVNDSLSVFEVKQDVSDLTTSNLDPTEAFSTITLPSDYAHFIGMYWNDSDSLDRAFDLVTDDQWDMRCASTLTIPSNKYPICKISSDKLYIKPSFDYESVTIGNQIWMLDNWDNNYTGSKVYNDDENNRAIYGGLYTWAMVTASDFAPDGWRLPTNQDFLDLMSFLGGAPNSCISCAVALKEEGTVHWTTDNGLDTTGFTALGSGLRTDAGAYISLKDIARYWSSTQVSGTSAYSMSISDANPQMDVNQIIDKDFYLSVRFIKETS
jgi:uncharacterized protein (TIGR02145 family)